jgi:hypothetical protein
MRLYAKLSSFKNGKSFSVNSFKKASEILLDEKLIFYNDGKPYAFCARKLASVSKISLFVLGKSRLFNFANFTPLSSSSINVSNETPTKISALLILYSFIFCYILFFFSYSSLFNWFKYSSSSSFVLSKNIKSFSMKLVIPSETNFFPDIFS